MAEEPAIANRDQLAEMLEGRTDEEITEFVSSMGVDTVLGQVFEAMTSAFQADKAAGQSAVIQWDITAGDTTHSYSVSVADGACTVASGAAESPRLTMSLSLADFMRFIAGKLDGMQAFMSGKLKLGGDMMFAQQMQAWFAA